MLSLPLLPETDDLLRLSSLELEQASAVKPEWVNAALQASPWVVVRRASTNGNLVPVGVRGKERAQRWAGFVNPEPIAQILPPNQLRKSLAENSRRGLRAFDSLRFLEMKVALKALDWGPGGSTGFELVSGSPTVTETSDLDIVIRAPEPFDRAFARSICIQLEGAPARVDVLVETPCCGFSLDEYGHSQLDKVLVRTGTGRILAEDPWDVRGGEAIVEVAFLFPGQGSQEPGMLHDLTPGQGTEAVLREMSGTLGFDVLSLDTAGALKSTIGVQLSLLASGVATARHLLRRSIRPSVVAGMSVGTFAAAVVADAISLSDATKLVRSRAEQMEGLYQAGYGMAAIIGLPESHISNIIKDVTTDSQPVFVSNLNAPRQIVVAGFVRAIEEVLARARQLGARKTELLRVSVPSHCPLMESVAHSLDQQLQDMEVRDPKCIYISNIHTRAVRTAKGVREDLANNIAHTVRWHEATEVAQQLGTQIYIEMPPGHVLSDLARDNLVGVAAHPVSSTNLEWLVAHVQH